MKLSKNLISQFVKLSKPKTEDKKESTLYGTIVSVTEETVNGVKEYIYNVQLDGAPDSAVQDPIPIRYNTDKKLYTSSTTEIKLNDRVIVTIKNHTATITGNLSSQAIGNDSPTVSTIRKKAENAESRVDEVKDFADGFDERVANLDTVTASLLAADEAHTNRFTANEATITNLTNENTRILGRLDAAEANIGTLETDKAEIAELQAAVARISTLESNTVKTTYLTSKYLTSEQIAAAYLDANEISAKYTNTDDLKAGYADIKLAEVDTADIGTLLNRVGLISEATITNGHVTGYLDSVEVNANNITAGTLTVDRLVISGTDKSILYEINKLGGVTATEFNRIDGGVIKKRTIAADHIVAGTITANELHSDSVTTDKILAGAVTASKISVTSLESIVAKIGSFTINQALYTNNHSAYNSNVDGVYVGSDYISTGKGGKTWFKNDGSASIGNGAITYDASTDEVNIVAKSIKMGSESVAKKSDIDDIEIGGRNLMLGSRYFDSDNTDYKVSTCGNSSVYNMGNGFYASKCVADWAGIRLGKSHSTEFIKTTNVGDTYTMSAVVKFNVETEVQVLFYALCVAPDGTRVYPSNATNDKGLYKGVPGNRQFGVYYTFKIDQGWHDLIEQGGTVSFTMQVKGATADSPIYIYSPKFERGGYPTDWSPAPEDMATADAAKTATNYITFDSANGLQIGNKSSGSWAGFRARITGAAYDILDSAGTVVASYGGKLIELGKNATDAIIKLCGGKGQIAYVTDDDTSDKYLQIEADKIRMKSGEMSSVYSTYTNNSTRWEKSAVNVSPTKVEMYASECIDPTMHDMLEGWDITEINVNSDGVDINTPGGVNVSAEGTIMLDGSSVEDTYGKFVSFIRGTSGIWTYNKYSNGDVEMWGSHTVSNVACTTALGNMYRTAVFSPSSFPFTVYSPNVVASYESDGYGAFLWATTTSTTSKPPSYYLVRPTSTTIASGKINFHIRGKWTN